ncbi:MAG TPA: KH domain-containing protein [Candidatus Sulfotelmatobacter sp.]|nr:KH domain-containing protein [Candidatus Sulfotelmatobacter sp.]
MPESSADVRTLVEVIAKQLVDAPGEVFVEKFDDGVIELEVAEDDIGKVIGRQGRIARAFRTLLNAAGYRARRRYTLEIIE